MQGRWIELPHLNFTHQCLRENKPIPAPPVNPAWLGCYHGIMRTSQGNNEFLSYDERPLVMSPTHWKPLPIPPKVKIK